MLLDAYLQDVVGRYHGRPLTDAELVLARASMSSEDLAEPRGVLLVARLHTTDVGCVGMRFFDREVGEVTSLFVAEGARRHGVGALLLDKIEAIAADRGLTTLRLDTRHDLIEARRLYARHGFCEVPAFNDEPIAERWFAKALKPSTA
jgi:ribosomal protein S18 acetylase RimI-like enzyme